MILTNETCILKRRSHLCDVPLLEAAERYELSFLILKD